MGHDQVYSQLFGKIKAFFSERETIATTTKTKLDYLAEVNWSSWTKVKGGLLSFSIETFKIKFYYH